MVVRAWSLLVSLLLGLSLGAALTGCGGDSAAKGTTAPESLTPLQMDPTAPADNAKETADDANAAIEEQSSDVQELTDQE